MEPIMLLGQRTGDARYIEWGKRVLAKWDEWWATHPEANHSCGYTAMKQFAAGEKQAYELRENIHAHTFHMALLGVAALYNATGKAEYRDVVLGSIDRLADEWVFLTGGMSSTERYVPRRFYHPRNDVEVCPQHTWILLLAQALEWTGEARYAAEIERDLFNHFLAAQLADGSNWSYFTPLNGSAQPPSSPNCCNAAGHRIAGRMPVYLYGLRDGAPTILIYTESEATLHPPGLPPVTLRQETRFPSEGTVTIHVQPESPTVFPLHLRIPSYTAGAKVQVGDNEPISAKPGDFTVMEREWKPGDVVRLSMSLPLRCQANDHVLAVVRGPLVYAYFQDAQEDRVVFHGRRGLYPEDVVLHIDPDRPEEGLKEEPASDELLGPALRVKGVIRARAPIFATSRASSELPGQQEQTLSLLPFANQGAIRGEYRVFMEYIRPTP
ncbi:MAG: glycoside hydrolase family 127 protein [Anaerolineae bacterium]|nr:glycoside hydrolase family 127 protein [Anaerolineae bacterium]